MAKSHIGSSRNKKLLFELNNLTRHAAILGTTGSGKTVMGKVLIEEAMIKDIPVIAIDPKGDIGGLGIINKQFDFRPFVGTGIKKAEKVANDQFNNLKDQEVSLENISKLLKTETKIYTPKSNNGIPVSLLPDLTAPPKFKKLTDDNPQIIADFVEPVSESITILANITGAKKDKAQSLISSILVFHWLKGKDVTFKSLIDDIVHPPFESIGSLDLEDFLKESDRKQIASSVNLILSSPSKKALQIGEKINVENMLNKNKLSVFDLRAATNNQEKQLIVEQILEKIYKFLIRKGGSQKLKYILYIDELAGILPPPPANPPCKKLLELLIRQARAFGLGIIVSTQNPGDIDYKIFGNIGSRFVGKLRMQNDIEKVATAMDIRPSDLKSDIGMLKTGDFVYNDAVKNKTLIMHARWLYSFHDSPLKKQELEWINDSSTRPKIEGKISLKSNSTKVKVVKKVVTKKSKTVKPISKNNSKPKEKISAKKLLKSLSTPKKNITKTVTSSKKSNDNLSAIIKHVKTHADKVQLKMALSEEKIFQPHLRIVVEPKNVIGLELENKGPYLFDLNAKLITLDNYFKQFTWSTYVHKDIDVEKHTSNIKRSFDYAIKEAKESLKTNYYKSTILKYDDLDRDEVERKNYILLMQEVKNKERQLDTKKYNEIVAIETKIRNNKDKITKYSIRIKSSKTHRILKNMLLGKHFQKITAEMKELEKRIKKLKKENERIKKGIKKIKEKYVKIKDGLRNQAFSKAHSSVKEYKYRPNRTDLIVHATIFLVPKKNHQIK